MFLKCSLVCFPGSESARDQTRLCPYACDHLSSLTSTNHWYLRQGSFCQDTRLKGQQSTVNSPLLSPTVPGTHEHSTQCFMRGYLWTVVSRPEKPGVRIAVRMCTWQGSFKYRRPWANMWWSAGEPLYPRFLFIFIIIHAVGNLHVFLGRVGSLNLRKPLGSPPSMIPKSS